MHIPLWLNVVSIVWIVAAILSSGYILRDIFGNDREMMPVMKWVWPITALYLGPLAIWAYRAMGARHAEQSEPFWHAVFKGVTHCGGGCTLGDIAGEWIVFIFGWTIAGIAFWPEIMLDFVLAFALGIVFQFYAIAPMRKLGVRDGLAAALKADSLSLLAFEIGLFAWMALSAFLFFDHDIHPDQPIYWFMMQVGMILGAATSFPMNWWLIRSGIKERM